MVILPDVCATGVEAVRGHCGLSYNDNSLCWILPQKVSQQ